AFEEEVLDLSAPLFCGGNLLSRRFRWRKRGETTPPVCAGVKLYRSGAPRERGRKFRSVLRDPARLELPDVVRLRYGRSPTYALDVVTILERHPVPRNLDFRKDEHGFLFRIGRCGDD